MQQNDGSWISCQGAECPNFEGIYFEFKQLNKNILTNRVRFICRKSAYRPAPVPYPRVQVAGRGKDAGCLTFPIFPALEALNQ